MRAPCRVVRFVVLGVLAGALVALLLRRARAAVAPPRAPHTPVWPPFETTPPPADRHDLAEPEAVVTEPDVAEPDEPEPDVAEAVGDRGERPRWVVPVDGRCPDGYPIKANDRSRIYHVPGGRSYERTVPERCYPDPESAAADGYRAAKA